MVVDVFVAQVIADHRQWDSGVNQPARVRMAEVVNARDAYDVDADPKDSLNLCPDLRQPGGAKGIRTPDPHTASVVRYQLRHSPLKLCSPKLHHLR